MARRPNLDALVVPKGEASVAAPLPESGQKNYAHTLSLRLTAEGYRSLRRYVAELEEETGKRMTHQALIEGLLLSFLAGHYKD